MIAAILFDLDGLMLDTEGIGVESWDHAAIDTGWAVPHPVRRLMIGRPMRAIEALLREHLPAEAPVDALLDRSNFHYHRLLRAQAPRHKPGLLPLLEAVRRQGLPRAVATSSAGPQAAAKLRDAGIDGFFPHVVSGDQVPQGKPHPDIFLEAAARLGVSPALCLVLEDSGPGIRAAHAAGMHRILVPDLHEPEPEVAALAGVVLPSLHHVREWLVERGVLTRA